MVTKQYTNTQHHLTMVEIKLGKIRVTIHITNAPQANNNNGTENCNSPINAEKGSAKKAGIKIIFIANNNILNVRVK
jgi:hypothetical protein